MKVLVNGTIGLSNGNRLFAVDCPIDEFIETLIKAKKVVKPKK